jgi:hypothetical protein
MTYQATDFPALARGEVVTVEGKRHMNESMNGFEISASLRLCG